jgi:tetratricopeptide (TPR) repeat protein
MLSYLTLFLTLTAQADTPLDTLAADQQELFVLAESAWEDGQLDKAEQVYAAVNKASPAFDRAWRRRCGVVLAQKRVAEAVELCKQAVSRRRSPENLTGLAIALTTPDPDDPADSSHRLDRAAGLLDETLQSRDDYLPAWQALCSWAMEATDLSALSRCVTRLEQDIPSEVGTLYFRTVLDLDLGETEHALATLQAAQARGLPQSLARPLSLRLQTEQTPVKEPSNSRVRTVANLKPVVSWSWADVIPLAIAAMLVLAVFLVAFIGGQDVDETV